MKRAAVSCAVAMFAAAAASTVYAQADVNPPFWEPPAKKAKPAKPGALAAKTAIPKLTQELMEKARISLMIAEVSASFDGQIKALGERGYTIGPDLQTHIKKHLTFAFPPERFTTIVARHLQGALTADEMRQVIAFNESPVGAALNADALADDAPDASEKRAAFADAVDKDPTKFRAREAVYKSLTEVARTAETYADTWAALEVVSLMAMKAGGAFPENTYDEVKATVAKDKAEVAKLVDAIDEVDFAYMAERMPEAEFNGYVEFATSPLGRKFAAAKIAAFRLAYQSGVDIYSAEVKRVFADVDIGANKELLEKSGIKTQIDSLPAIFEAQFAGFEARGLTLPDKAKAALKAAISAAFAPDKLFKLMAAGMGTGLTKAERKAILAFNDSPLGKNLKAAGEAMSTPEGLHKFKAFSEGAAKEPDKLQRHLPLYLAIDKATRTSQFTANTTMRSAVAMTSGFNRAMPISGVTEETLQAQLEQKRAEIEAGAKSTTLAVLAYMTETVTVDGMREYLKFASSPLGAKYNSIVMDAMDFALTRCASDYADELVQRFGAPGTGEPVKDL